MSDCTLILWAKLHHSCLIRQKLGRNLAGVRDSLLLCVDESLRYYENENDILPCDSGRDSGVMWEAGARKYTRGGGA